MDSRIQLNDVQRVVVQGYPLRRSSRWVLLRIDPERIAEVRLWLGEQISLVASAEKESRNNDVLDGSPRLMMAFTCHGLAKLGLKEDAMGGFDMAFRQGMHYPARSRKLGDVGEADPVNWRWGGVETLPDMLLVIYSMDNEARQQDWQRIDPTRHGMSVLHRVDSDLDERGSDKEYFGFRDGTSQPYIEGSGTSLIPGDRMSPSAGIKAGEFIIGYQNESGHFPDCPTVPGAMDTKGYLPGHHTSADRRRFGHNGTYLVLRQLQQHVESFDAFLQSQSQDAAEQELVAAKIVGRWRSGAPLVFAPDRDPGGLDRANAFAYHGDDRYGYKCPLGAHIRRANPRDALLDAARNETPAHAIKRVNQHRIIRRGRRYLIPASPAELPHQGGCGDDGPDHEAGPGLLPNKSSNKSPDGGAAKDKSSKNPPVVPEERGLMFACFNTSIENQFEFVQRSWVNSASFAGLHSENDPLVSSRNGGEGTFTIQAPGVNRQIRGLSDFVTLRGGAYFFLPGIKALRFLAALGTPGQEQSPGDAVAQESAW